MYQINGNYWSMLKIEADSPILRRSDGSRTVGVCDRNSKTIYVSDCLYGFFLKKVIIHEISHAYMFEYNVKLTIEQEELVCDLIATYGEDIIGTAKEIFNMLKNIA